MAIAFRSESHVVGTGTSPTGTEPVGTAQNDVLVALLVTDPAGQSLGIPAGWTSLHANFTVTLGKSYVLCYIVRGASAPSLAFTHSGSVYRELHLLSFSGADTTNPIDDFNTAVSTNGTSNNPNPPLVTATSTSDMAIAIGINSVGSAAGGYGAPSGYTIDTNNTAGYTAVMASKLLSASGSENPGAYTNSGAAAADSWAATLLLNPSGLPGNTTSPLLTSQYLSALSTVVTPHTLSVTVAATDELLVVVGITADSASTISTPTGGAGVVWTLQQSDTTASYCAVYVWTATNITPQTFTLSIASTNLTDWGFSFMKFDTAVSGNSVKGQNASGTPAVNLTTSSANSAALVIISDHNGGDGSSRTWLANAGAVNEQVYLRMVSTYTTYIGLHENAGAIGTYSVGLSAPSAQAYNMIALEVVGTVAPPTLVAWLTA